MLQTLMQVLLLRSENTVRTTCCLQPEEAILLHCSALVRCAGSQPCAGALWPQHQLQRGPPLMGDRPNTDWAARLSHSLRPTCERHYLQTSTSLLVGDVTEDGVNRGKCARQPFYYRKTGVGRNTAFLASENTPREDEEPAGAARGHAALQGLQRRTGAPPRKAHPGWLSGTSRPAPPRSPHRYRGGRRFLAPPAVASFRRPLVLGRRGLAPPPPPARRIALLPARTAAPQPGTLSRRRLGLLQLPLGGGSGARCLVPRTALGHVAAGRRRRLPQEPLEGRVTDQRFRAPLGHEEGPGAETPRNARLPAANAPPRRARMRAVHSPPPAWGGARRDHAAEGPRPPPHAQPRGPRNNEHEHAGPYSHRRQTTPHAMSYCKL